MSEDDKTAEQTPDQQQDGDKMAKRFEEFDKRINGVASKLDSVLTELKEERDRRRELEAAKAAVEAEAAEQSGDIESIKQQHAKMLEAERKRADEVSTKLARLVIDGGIRDGLSRRDVAPQLLKGAALAFKDGRNVIEKDGSAWVDGVPLDEAIEEWVGSDEGAIYKAAGHASGSGAPGGSNSAEKPLAELGDAERLKLARAGKLKPLMGAQH